MKTIDETRLDTDLQYRFGFLTDFMEFTDDDIAVIQAVADQLTPAVPALVDAVYDKLFSYDATKRHFVPRQSGYSGSLPSNMDKLDQDHEMIRFRKSHLAMYLTSLVSRQYDAKMVHYMDAVGQMHTSQAGSSVLNVPLVQMNALLGFVSDALLNVILGLQLESNTQALTLRAFNKLLWLQNDLINRHYASECG